MPGLKKNARVVVVGAGPVGMVCALALNKRVVEALDLVERQDFVFVREQDVDVLAHQLQELLADQAAKYSLIMLEV